MRKVVKKFSISSELAQKMVNAAMAKARPDNSSLIGLLNAEHMIGHRD